MSKTNRVRILNPIAGEESFTSSERAHALVDRGKAFFVEPSAIQFTRKFHLRQTEASQRAAIREQQRIAAEKGGVVAWNFADTRKGEVHPPFGPGQAARFPYPGVLSKLAKGARDGPAVFP